MLPSPPAPTAVVCHNDMLAIGVMRRLLERGHRIPDDISVVGFDDVFGADFCHPTLTTLAERTADAGARAVEVLVQQLPQRRVDGPDAGAADASGRAELHRSGVHAALSAPRPDMTDARR